MNIEIIISPQIDDFVEFNLFISSNSEYSIKKRKQYFYNILILYSFAVLFLIFLELYFLACLFLAYTILWALYYSQSQKNKNRKHFTNYFVDRLRNKNLSNIELNIDLENIFSKSEYSESKIKTKAIEKIIDLEKIIIITFLEGSDVIIPKRQIIPLEINISFFKTLCKHLTIKYEDQLNWKSV